MTDTRAASFANRHWLTLSNITASALLACLFALFVWAAQWQWHKADQKQALAQQFDAVGTQYQNYADALQTISSDPAQARYQAVELQGTWLSDQLIVLDNMSHRGQPGYHILTPLCCVLNKAVLVNRGWVPWRERDSSFRDLQTKQTGLLTVRGRWVSLPRAGIRTGVAKQPASSRVRSFPTTAELQSELRRELHPGQVWLAPGVADGFVREWHVAGLPSERHRAYAVQWGALALLVIVVYVVLIMRKLNSRNDRP